MHGTSLFLITGLTAISVFGQDAPQPLSLPAVSHLHGAPVAVDAVGAKDPANGYASHHEAAIAALKAGFTAGVNHQTDRAINLFLLAAKRDGRFGKALFDLGVMCERGTRWEDAAKFFTQVPLVDSTPDLSKLAGEELERVQLIASLEKTPEGKRSLAFDEELMRTLAKSKDPAIALDMASQLARNFPTRWEAAAAVGLFSASLDHWSDCATALGTAAGLAPQGHQLQLRNAAKMATQQDLFQTLVTSAERSWDDHSYEAASKKYAEAWELNATASNIGMQAAVGYLMADQLTPAVECLVRLQQASGAEARNASAMLEQLAPVSEAAKEAGSRPAGTKARDLPPEPALAIANNVGNLVSAEMLTVTKPPAELVDDNTAFIVIPDSDLTTTDLALLSSESVYARYEKTLPAVAEPAADNATPAPPSDVEPVPGEKVKEVPALPVKPVAPKPSRPVAPDTAHH